MPAPTALQRNPEALADDVAFSTPLPTETEGELLDMDTDNAPAVEALSAPTEYSQEVVMDDEGRPKFGPVSQVPLAFRRELRSIPIPPHRMTPLKNGRL